MSKYNLILVRSVLTIMFMRTSTLFCLSLAAICAVSSSVAFGAAATAPSGLRLLDPTEVTSTVESGTHVVVSNAAAGTDNYILSPDRVIPWKAGMPDGIPDYQVGVVVTNAPYNATGDGTNDDTAAFIAAIKDCPVGRAVYVPTGVYKLTAPLNITKAIVLRGDGASKTKLMTSATNGPGAIFIYGFSSPTISPCTNGYAKGSTVLALSSAAGFSDGNYARIQQTNDVSIVEGSVPAWSDFYQGQIFRITNVTGSVLGIDRPLYYTYNPSNDIKVKKINCVTNAGVENMFISMSGKCNSIIYMYQAARCWVRGVESTNCNFHHVMLDQTFQCEVRSNYFHHATTYVSGGYGMSIAGLATDNLVEDNVMYYLRHMVVLQNGASGNVVGYNYTARTFGTDPPSGTQYLMPSIECHGGHPMMNLIEGNIATTFMCDNYWGSSRYNTFLRNWSQVYSLGEGVVVKYGLWPLRVDAQNLYVNFIGNLCGVPGQSFDWTSSSTNLMGRDTSRFTTPQHDSLRWPVDDPRSQDTAISHGNYYFALGAAMWDPAITNHGTPKSYYLAGKPAWFGSLTWPPFGPDADTSSNVTNTPLLPAHARFLNVQY